jgi:hypothetical protein
MKSDTLHILNGDSIAPGFTKHFPHADYLVWREALCQGPLRYDLNDGRFKEERIQFLQKNFDGEIKKHLVDEIEELNLSHIKEVVLWFEYDLFCQINRMCAISWIANNIADAKIHILDLHKYQKGKYIGLGQINSDEYPSIFKNKILLTKPEISYIDSMWHKISNGDLQLLDYIRPSQKLHYFNIAMRNSAIYSNAHGLGAALIESRILSLLKKEGLAKNKLIASILKQSADLGYGDTQVENIINGLLEAKTLVMEDELVILSVS